MKTKPTLTFLVVFIIGYVINGQTVVCEKASCTANDYTLDYFYLGDENGTPYSPGYCDLGLNLETHIWTNFITNSAADRYSLYIHFNVYINGTFMETVDSCYYEYESVPTDILMNLYTFNWGCGDQIVLKDFYMSWQPNASKGCGCNGAKCYQIPSIDVQGPLITNFEYSSSCSTPNTLDFTSTTRGGVPPYTYTFLWDFGDGATSSLEAPSHTYESTGPYTVSLTVSDTKDYDTHEIAIPSFNSNFPPEIYAPSNSSIEGCSATDIPLLTFSSSAVNITEAEFNSIGGSIVLFNDLVSLTYIDVVSGVCPLTITRTFTVVDSCNKSETATQTIEINDTKPPSASNPDPINIQCASDIPAPSTTIVTDAIDNCSTPTISWVSDVSDSGLCPETITRTYRISDDCGNYIDVKQAIIINDDIAPTATNPEPVFVLCIEDVPPADINIITDEMDNCGTPQVAWVSDNNDANSCPTTITRTYSVTDSCNNSIFLEQIITVHDTTPPTGTAPPDANYQCISLVPEADPNSIIETADNCSTPAVAFVSDVATTNSCSEVITRTYSVTDDCNNETLLIQTITIEDTTLPTASAPDAIQVECIDDIPEPDSNVISDAQDNCSIPVVSFISDVSNGQTCPEIITRTYRVSDDCGNYIELEQQITIQDNTPPTASNPDTTYLDNNDAIPAQDPTIIIDEADNCGVPTVVFVSETKTQNTCEEILTRIYSVTDACGNSINVSHNIVINDNVPPTASNLAAIQLTCNNHIPSPDINLVSDATDNYTSPTVVYFSDVSDSLSCPETITRTYRVSDACGNFTDITQQIIIHDTIAPTASNPQKTVVPDTNSIPKPNPLIVTDEDDNCGVPVVTYIDETSNNETCSEIITRTYRVTDSCGNYTDVNHIIEIIDNVPPTGNNPIDTIVSCVNDIPLINPDVVTVASDNNGDFSITFLTEETGTKNCDDVIIRTYRITDGCGNYKDVNHNIFIIDDIKPQIDVELDPEIYLNCAVEPSPPAVTFSDNCTSNVSVTFNEEKTIIDSENYDIRRTWTATDMCNNTNSFEQVIHMSSYNETTTTALNVCISDPIIDLNSLINTSDNGNWTGSDMTVLNVNVFDPNTVPEGNYVFSYTTTNNSCKIINQFNIDLNDDCIVYSCISSTEDVDISKILTPNNDLRNDTFNVFYKLNEAIDDLSTCDIKVKVQIYNRWGTKVFESNDYDNTWQGTAPKNASGNAEKLPTGTYYYIVDLINSGLKPIQGYIYFGTK
ncbi:gliding motility-associated C-terminal domain-containing protein [Flavobacteriaceae bacterium GSB9]|nr:gliding motility-associated C-terminal domain-containing protein [Flavobacteriaceae bacterium GSB9]